MKTKKNGVLLEWPLYSTEILRKSAISILGNKLIIFNFINVNI